MFRAARFAHEHLSYLRPVHPAACPTSVPDRLDLSRLLLALLTSSTDASRPNFDPEYE